MKYQIITDGDGRICACSSNSRLAGAVSVDMPDAFTCTAQSDWRVANGAPVYDPLPQEEPLPDPVAALTAQNALLAAQVQALAARGEFLEDCIAEMAVQVYGA